MKLSELKNKLESVSELNFVLPDGTAIPKHFHVAEVGQISKHFIDCGGTIRKETAVNFQLWEAGDYDHRLAVNKLQTIISLSEKKLGLQDSDIEVEYQSNTIGKYGLEYDGRNFLLTTKQTACLASDSCGIPAAKNKINLSEIQQGNSACCTPGGGCC